MLNYFRLNYLLLFASIAFTAEVNYFSIEYGILGSQILFSLFTSFLINNQIKKEKDA